MRKRSGLQAAIVGAGLMGRWHAHFAHAAGAAITGIVDPDPPAARRLQKKFRTAACFLRLEDCLQQCPAAVVHVCAPTDFHFSLVSLALRHGRHVLVEKPAAASASQTEQLLSLGRACGVKMNPIHQFPFQRGFQRLRRNLGRLGSPVHVSYMACTAGAAGMSEAERRRILLEILPHPLSMFYALFGRGALESLEISGFAADGELEIAGSFLETRLCATVSLRGRPTRNFLTYIGSEGSACLDLFHGFCLLEDGAVSRRAKLLRPIQYGGKLLLSAGWNLAHRTLASQWAYPGLAELIGQFYRSIGSGRDAPISDDEILAVALTLDRLRPIILEAKEAQRRQ